MKTRISLIFLIAISLLECSFFIPEKVKQHDENTTKSLSVQKALENRLTLLKNDKGLVPFYRLDTLKFAAIAINNSGSDLFQKTMKLYAQITTFNIYDPKENLYEKYLDSLDKFNLIFISLHGISDSTVENFGISPQTINFINLLATRKSVVLDIFGSPMLLTKSFDIEKIKSILISYDDSELARKLSAQLLFGGIPAKGKIPITISPKYKAGAGVTLSLQIRFKYTTPEDVGANIEILNKADSLIIKAIKERAFPGCQVLAAKNGKVFYYKSFGYHTYDSTNKVSDFDLYDLASVTKVAGTTASLMKLYDDGLFDPAKKVSSYLSSLETTDKKEILCKEVLAHCSGLTPYLLFWSKTVSKKEHKWNTNIYSKTFSERFPLQVADSMFIEKDYPDSMYEYIAKSKLLPKKKYKYSDNGMYWMKKIIEKISKKPLDQFVDETYSAMLGAYTLCYNPLRKFKKLQITPTENDTAFRKQLIHGFVHDPGAAMLGGVGGHAGLFSNANDLAKLFQMFLNKGRYGGHQYLKKETIDFFNTPPYLKKGNRRALGFDKPEPNKKKESPVYRCVSLSAFGHQGFTGTVVWADPESGIVFVFLSNRVFPDAENKGIGQLAVRAKLQSIIYESLK